MIHARTLLVSALALTLSGLAGAQSMFSKPEDAIRYRQSALFVMGQHFGRVGAMVQGRVPFDAKTAADNIAIAESMSHLPWAAFTEGSDLGDTKAKPEIWSDNAKFKAAADKMQGEMAKLAAAAKTGNLDAIKAAFGPTGASCKACHDNFRAK